MEHNQEYTTFGRQIGYVIASNIAIILLGVLQLAILTKGLGTALYGTWSLINVTVSLVVPFAMVGFGMSIVRFLAAEKDQGRVREDFLSACFIVAITGVAFSALLFLLSDFLATSVFKDVGSSGYIRLASVLILLNSLQTMPLAFFRMRRRIGLYTILSLSYQAFQVGLIVLFISRGCELTGAITALIINGILFTVVPLLIILRQIGVHRPRFSNIKSYLKWGIPLTPNSAILWIIHVSDRYMVSYFLGVASAGIYSASYLLGNYASFALAPLGTVLYPTISKSYDEGNLTRTRDYLSYSVKYLMMIAIPSAFGLSVLAGPLLQRLTTTSFVAGGAVVPFVAFAAVLYCFYQVSVYVIHLVGKTRITVRLLGIAAVLNIALNLVLIPRMGIVGAAMATLIAYGVLGMLTLLATRRHLKFDLNLPFIGKSIASAAIMAVCIWLINPQALWAILLSILLGGAIYFTLLWAMKGFNKGEVAFFVNFIRGNLRKIGMFKE